MARHLRRLLQGDGGAAAVSADVTMACALVNFWLVFAAVVVAFSGCQLVARLAKDETGPWWELQWKREARLLAQYVPLGHSWQRANRV